MNKIAFVFGNLLIYWNSIIMAFAVLAGVLFFWAAFVRRSDHVAGAALLCPIAIVVSLLCARLIHWYFLADSYDGFSAAMTDFSGSGYALSGAFIGCLLTVTVLGFFRIVKEVPLTLDCMSIGGCAAIAIGRLGGFFTAENRGDILPGVESLPLTFPVVNTTSGAVEYRFATFLFQSVIAAIIFVIILVMFLRNADRQRFRDGDVALIFLLMYSASQIVLDSTRYDALRLRSNGFISVVQVLCAVTLAATIVIFSVRLCKTKGWKGSYLLIWLPIVACIGTAAYMEYHVQRHGDQALFAYSVMSGCLLLAVLLGISLWHMSKGQLQPKTKRVTKTVYKGKYSR